MRSPKPCWRSDAASWKPAWPAPTITTAPCAVRSGRYDAKRQGVEPAKCVIQPKLRFACQLERRNPLGERSEQRLAFEACHSLPDAAVNAGAEGHMAGGAAPNVESVRLVPTARIAVGRGEKQQHLFTVANPNAGHLDWSCGGAEEGLHRRLETQHFLEGAADQVGILAKYGPLLGVAGKAVQRVAEPVDRGVDAGGKKGAHQHARFVFRQFARIDGLKNLHA